MKTKFKIHIFYYLLALISIFNGFFKNFIYITIIIFVHEIGHIFGSYICKWKIDKIVILPFGGITIFNELLNRKIKEELLIVSLGPIFQMVFTYIINLKLKSPLFLNYSYIILLFNLIPVIPLDGSKIFNLITDYLFPYKISQKITLYNSIILIILFMIYIIFNFNLILLLIIIFLFIKNIKEYKNKEYKYSKFVLERYNYNLDFNKYKIINDKNAYKMQRDYKHIFIYNNKQHTEKEFLSILFDNKRKIC